MDMSVFSAESDVVTVTPPGSDEPVHLRYPSFAEWHSLAKAHRDLDGGTPPADLIARTLTVCMCDAEGKPLGMEAGKVMKFPHRRVMWVYSRCWETVLLSGDQVVQELEKNSAAGQD
jgi:hypothetical protein